MVGREQRRKVRVIAPDVMVPDLAESAIGKSQENDVVGRNAEMPKRGTSFVHTHFTEIHGARRVAGMHVIAIASITAAAGEVDDVDRNMVLGRSANDTRMRGVVVLVCAKYQNRFRQRVDGELKPIVRHR